MLWRALAKALDNAAFKGKRPLGKGKLLETREANILSVEGLWHPSIEKAVGNSLKLHKDQHVLFLTGANMAGKSTWMKSVGVGLYLAHCGFPVAARAMGITEDRQGMMIIRNEGILEMLK